MWRHDHCVPEVDEAYDLNRPVEPGVRDGRNALVRWAVLLEDVIP
jgi:hypothetical protein